MKPFRRKDFFFRETTHGFTFWIIRQGYRYKYRQYNQKVLYSLEEQKDSSYSEVEFTDNYSKFIAKIINN